MTARERILSIRVLADVARDPAFAERLGLSARLREKKHSDTQNEKRNEPKNNLVR